VTFSVASDFFSYEDGVYSNANCNKDALATHSLLIVGFGTDQSQGDFWLVQNSWGTDWGQQGFGKIARG
jgi:cathepsin L